MLVLLKIWHFIRLFFAMKLRSRATPNGAPIHEQSLAVLSERVELAFQILPLFRRDDPSFLNANASRFGFNDRSFRAKKAK
jgi:hypothetical protein